MKKVISIATIITVLCACGTDPNQGTLTQNVGASFATCSDAEIKYMASRHNLMTAFEPCGANRFQYFSWAPDGKHLYFQLVMTGYVMDADADDKATVTVPTTEPLGPPAWLSAARLILFVGPEQGDETKPNRLALFDIDQSSVMYQDLPGISDATDLQRVSNAELLFLGKMNGGPPTVFRHNVEMGATTVAFPWHSGPVETLAYTPQQDALSIGHENTVTLYKGETGNVIESWTPAIRGTLHPKGDWMALEFEGESISIFNQRAWDELSENARARELARLKDFEDRLPDGYETMVRPPSISVVDMKTKKRWAFTGFLGYRWQWYEAADYYASFMLWGFEGKQYKRNVMLGNIADRLNTIEREGTMMGTVPFVAPKEPDKNEGE
ncbi:MAG: hypothetical protein HN348_00985 [Proteobacteria bacterium]|jgi:hypothetical protein|nr:hypothetical protein [Pseudomonadota bacterium]